MLRALPPWRRLSSLAAPVGRVAAMIRHLVVVLGDQLDQDSAAFDGFDPAHDRIWMCESTEESASTWSSVQRIAVFLSAMRHFAQRLRVSGWPLDYRQSTDSIADCLAHDLARLRPERVVLVEPGEWRVRDDLARVCAAAGVTLEERTDRHFLCTRALFLRHAQGRRQLRMEYFYREMRERHRVLMDDAETGGPARPDSTKLSPAGGEWNFDHDNREAFGSGGPVGVPPPKRFAVDALTRAVIEDVRARFSDHPGQLDDFGWPVTREQALEALADFIEHRLPSFGRWQDAMWTGEPWLWHAHLAAAMNLKLIRPLEVIQAAETERATPSTAR